MPYLRRKDRPGHREHEVVGELVEGALDAEVGREGEREDDRVRREVAAGVVADQQHAALLGDVAQPAHLAAEVQRAQQPQARQALADVVRVALVEVGGRDAAGDEALDARRAPRRAPPPEPSSGSVLARRAARSVRRAAVGASRGRWWRSARSRRLAARAARPERVDAGEEALEQAVGAAPGARPAARGRSRRARSARRGAASARRGAGSRAGSACRARTRRTSPAARARPGAGRSRRGRTGCSR